ncbi:MAG: hypothetical protein WBM74_10480 [Polyangiales bacterium]
MAPVALAWSFAFLALTIPKTCGTGGTSKKRGYRAGVPMGGTLVPGLSQTLRVSPCVQSVIPARTIFQAQSSSVKQCCHQSAGLHPRHRGEIACDEEHADDACCQRGVVHPFIQNRAWTAPIWYNPARDQEQPEPRKR